MKTYFTIVSSLGEGPPFAIIPLVAVMLPPEKSLSFIYLVTISVYLVGIGKMFYSRARPGELSNSIATTCEPDYGSPSGHSLLGTAAYLFIALQINSTLLKSREEKQVKTT